MALVHDWLNGMRGGEKVFEVFCELFPNATVFTLFYEPDRLSETIRRMNVVESPLARLPGARKRYRWLLPILPLAVERFPTQDFDLVISASHCVAKAARPPRQGLHLCYCFTPMRYIWDQFDQYFPAGPGPLEWSGFVKAEDWKGLKSSASEWAKRMGMLLARGHLQRWDRRTADRVDAFFADSRNVARKIRRYYGRTSKVVYPPADTEFFTPGEEAGRGHAEGAKGKRRAGGSGGEGPVDDAPFLVVSALVPYKRIDRAVEAANALGRRLVVVGDEQPADVHAIGHAINQALGNVGETVVFTEPIEARPVDQLASLWELVNDMEAGRVDTLLVIDANPVYTAPADMRFADRLSKVRLRVHLGLLADETASLCHWQIPMAHYLESWSDTRAADGTVTIIQPLIAPLYAGRTAHELVAALTKQSGQTSYEIVRAYWQARAGQTGPQGGGATPQGAASEQAPPPQPAAAGTGAGAPPRQPAPAQPAGAADFERFWRRALHDGLVAGTAAPVKAVTPRPPAEPPRPSAKGLEIAFRADPCVFDGRFANNAWLQELPKPGTKLTWDNAALLSPKTAERLGVQRDDVIELRYRGRRVAAPVWVLPGQAADTVTVHLGYGRTRAGQVGSGLGFDAYQLRTSHAPWSEHGLEIGPTGRRHQLVSAQNQQSVEGRNVLRAATLERFKGHPGFAHEGAEAPARDMTLYPEHSYPGYAWAMTIDLSTCLGCNACVAACNAENNIPAVGKVEVGRGHRMHWLRVDRYYSGDPENPEAFNQPVPCMQCENAPCEVVCPVGATVHSEDGLNDMVYNRCVGTRYCSNNCPYKVRRFNFFRYQDWNTPSLKMVHNPDVTVRSRGVMEKCTYCVQRINAAKIEAEKENRRVRDGEVVTACAAACPTQAIVFGDANDPNSQVARLKAEPLNYGMLEDLNTRPRTTYLAAVRNPNPEMPGAAEPDHAA